MPLPVGWAVGVIRDVLEGVAALHAVGLDVAHGIITPDRVFVDGDGHVRIADYVFGYCTPAVSLYSGSLCA